jgi:manganese-dependent inorganic pyrophosphatase
MHSTLITSYDNPDLDGVAGIIAYAEFLEKTGTASNIGILGEPHDEAKYMLDRFNISYPPCIETGDDFDNIVLIDSSGLNSLKGKIDPGKVIEIIDHRLIHEGEKFPNAKLQIELVGAVATLITEKFITNDIEISKKSSILLYGAILSNTFNFKGSISTERDRQAAQWLNETAKLPENFWKELFIAKSDLSAEKLTQRMSGDFAFYQWGDKKVGIAQIEIIGVKKLLNERRNEIVEHLENIKQEMNLDFIFQNTIELENVQNFYVTGDLGTQKILQHLLEIEFINNVAEGTVPLMRKQIVPILKKYFTSLTDSGSS